jgi:hypothetical protein
MGKQLDGTLEGSHIFQRTMTSNWTAWFDADEVAPVGCTENHPSSNKANPLIMQSGP